MSIANMAKSARIAPEEIKRKGVNVLIKSRREDPKEMLLRAELDRFLTFVSSGRLQFRYLPCEYGTKRGLKVWIGKVKGLEILTGLDNTHVTGLIIHPEKILSIELVWERGKNWDELEQLGKGGELGFGLLALEAPPGGYLWTRGTGRDYVRIREKRYGVLRQNRVRLDILPPAEPVEETERPRSTITGTDQGIT